MWRLNIYDQIWEQEFWNRMSEPMYQPSKQAIDYGKADAARFAAIKTRTAQQNMVNNEAGKGAQGGGGNPYQYSGKEPPVTLSQFWGKYHGQSYSNIVTEAGWTDGMPAGPKMRYVTNPNDGKVMDMRHVMVVGFGGTMVMGGNPIKGNIMGLGVEVAQWIGPLIPFVDLSHTRGSAFNRQDFYSNNLGAMFGTHYLFTGQSHQDWTSSFYLFLNKKK